MELSSFIGEQVYLQKNDRHNYFSDRFEINLRAFLGRLEQWFPNFLKSAQQIAEEKYCAHYIIKNTFTFLKNYSHYGSIIFVYTNYVKGYKELIKNRVLANI